MNLIRDFLLGHGSGHYLLRWAFLLLAVAVFLWPIGSAIATIRKGVKRISGTVPEPNSLALGIVTQNAGVNGMIRTGLLLALGFCVGWYANAIYTRADYAREHAAWEVRNAEIQQLTAQWQNEFAAWIAKKPKENK